MACCHLARENPPAPLKCSTVRSSSCWRRGERDGPCVDDRATDRRAPADRGEPEFDVSLVPVREVGKTTRLYRADVRFRIPSPARRNTSSEARKSSVASSIRSAAERQELLAPGAVVCLDAGASQRASTVVPSARAVGAPTGVTLCVDEFGGGPTEAAGVSAHSFVTPINPANPTHAATIAEAPNLPIRSLDPTLVPAGTPR